MQHDKAKLGTRYSCFQCGTKFYDLNRPEPICPNPDCKANQVDAPANDIRTILLARRRAAKAAKAAAKAAEEEEETPDDDDLGDLDLDDDDDDVDDEDSED